VIVPFLVFTPMLKAEIDHQQALVIWQRARVAHGIGEKIRVPTISWYAAKALPNDEAKVDVSTRWRMSSQDEMAIFDGHKFTLLSAESAFEYDDNERVLTSKEIANVRSTFLRHPYGILNGPKQSILRPLGTHGFSVRVKGLTTNVYLEPKSNLIWKIEFVDTDGSDILREFSYSHRIFDENEHSTEEHPYWMPQIWRDTISGGKISKTTQVEYHIKTGCWGTPIWVPEGYSIDP